jgi:FecR protein
MKDMSDTSDDYLWDRSGEPDADVERLERALATYRRPLPALPDLGSRRDRLRQGYGGPPKLHAKADDRPVHVSPARRSVASIVLPIATAAAVAGLVVFAGWYASSTSRAGYAVAAAAGAPRIGGGAIETDGRLRPGDWLETDASSRATIEVGVIGRVDVESNTRVQMVGARGGEHRLSLAEGRIQATIWAPPRFFFVETPSAVAVDLGCAYTLDVDPQGAGLLRVLHGWVGFEHEGRESFIPEQALCRTRPRVGPGTPYFENAPRALVDALAAIDFGDAAAKRAALDVALAVARRADALSLWHLLTRVERGDVGRVYDRLAGLVPPPDGVTREGIARGNRRMLDEWWNELGLRSASWWRLWKAPWPRPR